MSKMGRVLVAMSGGIDSTVTAILLQEQGYEVIGITMKTWDYANSGGSKKETGCCSLDSINDAREIAVSRGFHHFIIDIREEFGDYVIDNFVEEYMAGRTPNPCVLCNTHIKWNALLKRADSLDCEYIATGHYAKIGQHKDRKFIQMANDRHKDQSYVLWGLSQACLDRSLFPIGGMQKSEVREYAAQMGYESLSKKAESYEICFVPDNDYRGFLKRKDPSLENRVKGGRFINNKGENLGTHEGYPFFTVGQRRGLGIAFGTPMYVSDIQPDTNTVVLGEVDDLLKNTMRVYKVNSMKYDSIPVEHEALTLIRYNDKGSLSILNPRPDDSIDVRFLSNVRGVAPGQSAVFFEGHDLIGGGIIQSNQ